MYNHFVKLIFSLPKIYPAIVSTDRILCFVRQLPQMYIFMIRLSGNTISSKPDDGPCITHGIGSRNLRHINIDIRLTMSYTVLVHAIQYKQEEDSWNYLLTITQVNLSTDKYLTR